MSVVFLYANFSQSSHEACEDSSTLHTYTLPYYRTSHRGEASAAYSGLKGELFPLCGAFHRPSQRGLRRIWLPHEERGAKQRGFLTAVRCSLCMLHYCVSQIFWDGVRSFPLSASLASCHSMPTVDPLRARLANSPAKESMGNGFLVDRGADPDGMLFCPMSVHAIYEFRIYPHINFLRKDSGHLVDRAPHSSA